MRHRYNHRNHTASIATSTLSHNNSFKTTPKTVPGGTELWRVLERGQKSGGGKKKLYNGRRFMNRGKYIVLEGPEGVGKTTMAKLVVHELERLGVPAQSMHEPDGNADLTTQQIRKLTQDPQYPMNTRTEVLLYNAARSQSLEYIRKARDAGKICVVDRSYLSTLAVQFYGRGDVADYQKLNYIIEFAVGDMWPDLTIVLDAPVDLLQTRANKRGVTERFDSLSADMLERIRAGYLWEAKQRDMPVVYATGRIDEVFQDVWRHVAAVAKLENEAVSEPVALAELLAKSPAIDVLQSKQRRSHPIETTYFTPPSLPDDIQCDFCDGIERILRMRQQLVVRLAPHLQDSEANGHLKNMESKAEEILAGLLPVACASEETRQLLDRQEALELEKETLLLLPQGFGDANESPKLISVQPRNELDLLPVMLYEALDLPLNEVKRTVEKWPYEAKSHVFAQYLAQFPGGKALAHAQYTWELLTPCSAIADVPAELMRTAQLQPLSPRYGYAIPAEVEVAGLSDDYDAVFDASLEVQSMLQARGFSAESAYATLLGHKQRWSLHTTYAQIPQLEKVSSDVLTQLKTQHPLLFENY